MHMLCTLRTVDVSSYNLIYWCSSYGTFPFGFNDMSNQSRSRAFGPTFCTFCLLLFTRVGCPPWAARFKAT